MNQMKYLRFRHESLNNLFERLQACMASLPRFRFHFVLGGYLPESDHTF